MAARIHPTAIIEPGALLGSDVEIGAYAFVGAEVRIGDRTRLHHHASVEGDTHLGVACEVFPYACVGGKSQDLKFKGGRPGLRAGDRNVFREYVTAHSATFDGDLTRIGSDNTFLACSHIAHDCVLGNHIIMSNGAVLAGHVSVDDHVVIGGYGGLHQFCRAGAYAMIAAYSKVVQDAPPYCIVDGNPGVVRAINKVGLERQGFVPEQLDRIKQLYRTLYRDGLNRAQALEKLDAHPAAASEEFQRMISFAKRSERGLAPRG